MTTLRTPTQLCDRGLISSDQRAALEAVAVALRGRIAAGIDPADRSQRSGRSDRAAIRAGYVAELDHRPEELADPIGDETHSPVEGIVHRYPDRVLFKLTHVCAVYCRFCFRREMIGPDKPNALSPQEVARALDYIRMHPEIWEVILTGGDPLILSARRLRAVMKSLAAIDHVKVIRIHTRMPVADPERISSELVRAMKIKGKATYVAVHVNHPRELTPQARSACARIADAGIPLALADGAARRRQ